MKKIEISLTDFLHTVQHDFIGLLAKIEQMKGNMTRLVQDRKRTESMLAEAQTKRLGVRSTQDNDA